MVALARRCAVVVKHTPRRIIGQAESGAPRSSEAAAYPKLMATTYALAVQRAWLQKLKPKQHKHLSDFPLATFKEKSIYIHKKTCMWQVGKLVLDYVPHP